MAPDGDNGKPRLSQAVRRHWYHLVGVAAFPTFLFFGGHVWGISDDLILIVFLSVMFFAMWPWLSCKAPYSFWIIAILVYFLGAFFGMLIFRTWQRNRG